MGKVIFDLFVVNECGCFVILFFSFFVCVSGEEGVGVNSGGNIKGATMIRRLCSAIRSAFETSTIFDKAFLPWPNQLVTFVF